MRKLNWIAAACLSLLVCAGVRAGAPTVGEKPELTFTDVNGEQVSLANLKGKIVVVDFWATWCQPCMQQAPHIVDLNKRYADKGLQIIGVSLDDDKAKMLSVAKQSSFTWPQYYDGGGWKTKLAVAWGIDSIPRTFVFSPEGELLWTGHPALLDQVLDDAFKKHPPFLVDPVIVAAANKQLDGVAASLKDGDIIQAMKLMAAVTPDAKKDGVFAARAATVASSLEASGDKLVAEVDSMIAAKQYGAASSRLADLMKALPGTSVATKARAKLDEMNKSPEARAGIEAEKRNTAAAAALETATKLKAAGKDEQAYPLFKSVAKTYAGTAPGTTAAAVVVEYEKDTAFVKRVNEAAGGAKAKAAMSMAASYVEAGRTDLAKKKYQEVIDQFPGTSYEATAKTELAKLH